MDKCPRISIIIPAKNAAGHIAECLESIGRLDYPPEALEIIVADGLSQDTTAAVAARYGAKVVANRKQTVGPGRNAAFAQAQGDYIVFTDADCTFMPGYLNNALNYFRDESVAGVSGPAITPPDSSCFEKAVGTVYQWATLAVGSVHNEHIDRVREVADIPGCNSIYRAQALKNAMPYDETLLTAEDADLNSRLRQQGYRLISAPDVAVNHRRRSRPALFFRQMYRFAVGRLQAGKKDRRLIGAGHVAAGVSLPLVLLALAICSAAASLSLAVYLAFWAALAGSCAVLIIALLHTRSFPVSIMVVGALCIALAGWSLGFMRELAFPIKDVKGK